MEVSLSLLSATHELRRDVSFVLKDSNKRPAKEVQLPAEKRLKASKVDSAPDKENEEK